MLGVLACLHGGSPARRLAPNLLRWTPASSSDSRPISTAAAVGKTAFRPALPGILQNVYAHFFSSSCHMRSQSFHHSTNKGLPLAAYSTNTTTSTTITQPASTPLNSLAAQQQRSSTTAPTSTGDTVWSLPNMLSIARGMSGPGIAYLILHEQWPWALGALTVSGVRVRVCISPLFYCFLGQTATRSF